MPSQKFKPLTDDQLDQVRAALRARIDAGEKLTTVAHDCNTSPSYLRSLLAGLTRPGATTGARIAQVAGVAIEAVTPVYAPTDLWRAATAFKPDRLLADITPGMTRVSVIRRGEVVREFTGRDPADVSVEMQRCAS